MIDKKHSLHVPQKLAIRIRGLLISVDMTSHFAMTQCTKFINNRGPGWLNEFGS